MNALQSSIHLTWKSIYLFNSAYLCGSSNHILYYFLCISGNMCFKHIYNERILEFHFMSSFVNHNWSDFHGFSSLMERILVFRCITFLSNATQQWYANAAESFIGWSEWLLTMFAHYKFIINESWTAWLYSCIFRTLFEYHLGLGNCRRLMKISRFLSFIVVLLKIEVTQKLITS